MISTFLLNDLSGFSFPKPSMGIIALSFDVKLLSNSHLKRNCENLKTDLENINKVSTQH